MACPASKTEQKQQTAGVETEERRHLRLFVIPADAMALEEGKQVLVTPEEVPCRENILKLHCKVAGVGPHVCQQVMYAHALGDARRAGFHAARAL